MKNKAKLTSRKFSVSRDIEQAPLLKPTDRKTTKKIHTCISCIRNFLDSKDQFNLIIEGAPITAVMSCIAYGRFLQRGTEN